MVSLLSVVGGLSTQRGLLRARVLACVCEPYTDHHQRSSVLVWRVKRRIRYGMVYHISCVNAVLLITILRSGDGRRGPRGSSQAEGQVGLGPRGPCQEGGRGVSRGVRRRVQVGVGSHPVGVGYIRRGAREETEGGRERGRELNALVRYARSTQRNYYSYS